MREVKKYIANDGREFDSEEDCIEYENPKQELIRHIKCGKCMDSGWVVTHTIGYDDIKGKCGCKG